MRKTEIESLRAAVERLHGCPAVYRSAETVSDTFRGQVAWTREVATFDLSGHPTATVCYAWLETSPQREYAVLRAGPVKSAIDAVRASIVAEARGESFPKEQGR